MSDRKSQLLSISMLISDLLITNFSFVVSGLIVNLVLFGGRQTLVLFQLLCFFNTTWFVAALFFRLYKLNVNSGLEETYRRSCQTVLAQAALFSLFVYVIGYKSYTLKAIAVCYTFMGLLLLLSRLALTFVSKFVIRATRLHKKIAIVGYNARAKELAAYFADNQNIYSFEGYFDNTQLSTSGVGAGGQLLGSIAECIDYAIEKGVSEIYSTILPEHDAQVEQLVRNAENNCVRVKFIAEPTQSEVAGSGTFMEYIHTMPVVGLRSEPLTLLKNRMQKRIADIVVSLMVVLFVLSWLTPVLALIIKLTSRGPIFFRQQRSGKDDNIFWCIKFRSMTVNEASDQKQAEKKDARITRIGAFMRKTSLDELPQFFNVLSGHMSICGPRPHMLLHTAMYRHSIDKYMVRHLVKPGITGWAQVNGYRGETADQYLMEKRVEHDIWYLENWSLLLDCKIMVLTVINAIRGEQNAY